MINLLIFNDYLKSMLIIILDWLIILFIYNWQVLEIMEEGETDIEKWKMPEEEEEQEEEFWGFEDLEYEYDSSFSMSLPDSVGST